MNNNQKLSPKYWVGHSKKTDDVFIETIDKSHSRVLDNMDLMFGDSWYGDDNYEVILIEIKEVTL